MLLDVRTARPDEWRQARDLRLEMLADTPLAYLDRLDQARARPDEIWQRHHVERLQHPRVSTVVAATDTTGRWRGQMAGMVGLFAEPSRVWLGAVYLAPDLRGSGAAAAMLALVEDWARGLGFEELHLEVNEANQRAIGFYRRAGFTMTGAHRPYPLDPSLAELEMVHRW